MTPKEKAEELVERYEVLTTGWNYIEDAKKCALICVNEMHKAIEHFYGQDKEVSEYIEEIKQEINKL